MFLWPEKSIEAALQVFWENCLQASKEKPQEIQTSNLMQKKQMESGTRIYS